MEANDLSAVYQVNRPLNQIKVHFRCFFGVSGKNFALANRPLDMPQECKLKNVLVSHCFFKASSTWNGSLLHQITSGYCQPRPPGQHDTYIRSCLRVIEVWQCDNLLNWFCIEIFTVFTVQVMVEVLFSPKFNRLNRLFKLSFPNTGTRPTKAIKFLSKLHGKGLRRVVPLQGGRPGGGCQGS